MKKIIVINGPNLNLLGNRERNIYGKNSLDEIKLQVEKKCKELNLDCLFCQSNNEGDLIDFVQSTVNEFDGLIINPAAFTHTSVALLDALRTVDKPKIEIHLSNIYTREDYRKKSITSEGVNGLICGFGTLSYILAVEAINKLINKK
jgi:3-dehydroquinate dehydratase-2